MKIFFDESGSFISRNQVSDSFVVAMVIPEMFEKEISSEFLEWKRSISEGEVKGGSLDIVERMNFCEWIAEKKGILKINCILNRHINHSKLPLYRKMTADNLKETILFYKKKFGENCSICDFLKEYEGKIRNQSRFPDSEYYQAMLYNDSIRESIQYSIAHFMDDRYKEAFHDYFFIFDRKLKTKLSACEKFTVNYLPFIWDNHARLGVDPPLGMPIHWKNSIHPFNLNFFKEGDALSLSNLFRNGFEFEDSKKHIGLQIVDILVNTVYQNFTVTDDKSIRQCYNTLSPIVGTTGGSDIISLALKPPK